MLSEDSWRHLLKTFDSGYNWGIFPFKLVSRDGFYHMDSRKTTTVPKCLAVVGMTINFPLIVGYPVAIYIFYTRDKNYSLALLTLGFMSLTMFTTGLQLWHLLCMDNVAKLVATFHKFDNRLHKVFKVPLHSRKPDGYELCAKIVNWSFHCIRICSAPCVLMFVNFTNNGISNVMFEIGSSILDFLVPIGFPPFWYPIFVSTVAMFGTFAMIHGAFCAFMFINCSLIYTNSTRHWIAKLRTDTEQRRYGSALLRFIYVCHQVQAQYCNAVYAALVEYSLYISLSVAILYIYITVRFASEQYIPVLYITVSTTLIITYTIKSSISLAVCCHRYSADHCSKNVETNRQDPYCYRFWKARRPVTIHVGKHFVLDSKDYVLTIFGDIVLNNVIDLLVAV